MIKNKRPALWILAAALAACLALTGCIQTEVRPSESDTETTGQTDAPTGDLTEALTGAATVSPAYSANAAYIGWAESSEVFPYALNAGAMKTDSVRHLPIFKLDTAAELAQFKTTFEKTFVMGGGYNDNPSFDGLTADLDDGFFREHTLLLIYVSAGSGSFRFGVRDITCGEGACCVSVTQLNHPEAYTADMAGWLVAVEVLKADLQGITGFDAILQ